MTRKSNRLTLEQLKKIELPNWLDDEYVRQATKARHKKLKELETRVKRLDALRKLDNTHDLKTVMR